MVIIIKGWRRSVPVSGVHGPRGATSRWSRPQTIADQIKKKVVLKRVYGNRPGAQI